MRLAVCAEMMFLELPITERVQRIAEAGFDALARFRAAFTA